LDFGTGTLGANKNYIIQTRRIATYFEGLNSSLAQLPGELVVQSDGKKVAHVDRKGKLTQRQ